MTDQTPDAIDVESTDRTPALRQPAAVVTPTTPPAEWGVIVAQAEVLARSAIIPDSYRGRPENIIAAAITGRQFGWDVMAAMRNTHVIEGTVAIRPEAQVGLVRAAGHSISGSSSSTRAEATGRRADTGDTMTVEWTIDDAVRAGLCSIRDGQPYARSQRGKPLPWETFTSDMLWARAVSQLCRRLFSDVTLGLSYTPDEVEHFSTAADFSGDVADPFAPAVLPPPDGWESWEECERLHADLRRQVAEADPQARNQWQGYLRDSGYEAWFTRAQHDELAAQLEILVATPTERVASTIPEAEVVPDAAENGDQDGAALSLLDGTAVPAPGESGPEVAGEAPVPAPSDVPAPGGAPITKAQQNQIGALAGTLGLDRDTRLAILGFCAQREVATMKDLTTVEAGWGIGALKHMVKGTMEWRPATEDEPGTLILVDPTDGMVEDPSRLPAAAWMRDFAEHYGMTFEMTDSPDQEA